MQQTEPEIQPPSEHAQPQPDSLDRSEPPAQPETRLSAWDSPVHGEDDEGGGETSGSNAVPSVSPGAEVANIHVSPKWPALVFILTLGIFVALVPRFVRYSSPPTGDQPHYLMVAMSIIQDGDINVANNYAQHDEDTFYGLAPHPPDFVGIPAPYPLPPHLAFTTARPSSEWYNFHFPGLSLLVVPAWVIGGWFSLWWPATVVFMCLLGALVAVNIFMLSYQLTGKVWIGIAVWSPLIFANPLMSYSYLIFTELPSALLSLYAFRRLSLGWRANGPLRLILVGLCIGYLPWLTWRDIIVSIPLGIYALVQWIRAMLLERAERAASKEPQPGSQSMLRRSSFLSMIWLLAPVALCAVLILWHNLFLFGAIAPPASVPELGSAVDPFMMPWAGPEAFNRFTWHLFAHLFDRQMGLLTSTPLYLLAFVGAIALFRSARRADRRLLFWIAATCLPFVFMVTAFNYWNGLWNPPARFFTTFIALMSAPLAMSLAAISAGWAAWAYRAVYALLALPGIGIMALRMNDARMFWPAYPVWEWFAGSLDWPYHFDLRNALPAFDPLDDLRMPLNSGWITAVSLGIVFGCYLLMLCSGRPAVPAGTTAPRRLPYAVHGVAWVAVLAVLAGGWYVVNADNLKPRTILTEVGRWGVSPGLVAPRGMTFHGGMVYITDYDGQAVGLLNTVTGVYTRTVPVIPGATEPAAYTHPGDVKVGRDGLLYVLNNGHGDDTLWGINLDNMMVERRVNLHGASSIAAGLDIAPDGTFVIGDTVGGRVIRYPHEGGEPMQVLGGELGGFNNVMGVAVTPGGSILAAEMSNQRVQELDANGNFMRAFKLPCPPTYVVVSPTEPDWADTICNEKGVISLNLKSGIVQMSRVAGDYPDMNPTGALAYAGDGTLYVVDHDTVRAFKVKH